MSAWARSIALGLWVFIFWGSAQAQGPPPVTQQERQDFVNSLATEWALKVGDLAKGVIVGTLNDDVGAAFLRWASTLRTWKNVHGAGASPYLAEGVLFDCVGRMTGVRTPVLSGEKPTPFFFDLADGRPGRAVEAFERALQRDPDLHEARFRAARIRAKSDATAARTLEELASDAANPLLAYLSAVSRAEVAVAKSDLALASVWYRRAQTIHPSSAAAAVGLASLMPGQSLSFAGVDSNDPYYLYPCRILTKEVDEQLAARIRAVTK